MAGIKIVDLPPLGRDLASTDLLELSLAGGTGSRKITGQEIMNASKLSINNTPIINGTVGRVLFQGTGDVLQQSSSLFWDATNNRLGIGTSSPTNPLDIRNADATMDMLRIQCTSVNGYSSIGFFNNAGVQSGGFGYGNASANALPDVIYFYSINKNILFNTNGGSNERMRIAQSSGNVLIGTTTDAGFRLDVNGTARVSTSLTILSPNATQNAVISHDNSDAFITLSSSTNSIKFNKPIRPLTNNNVNIGDWNSNWNQIYARQFQPTYGSATFVPYGFTDGLANAIQTGMFGGTGFLAFSVVGTEAARFAATTRNLLINTTTDDGFKLDVNGTARVSGPSIVRVGGTNLNISLFTVDITQSAAITPGNSTPKGLVVAGTYNDTNVGNNTIYQPLFSVETLISSTTSTYSGVSRNLINLSPSMESIGRDLNNNTTIINVTPSFTFRNVNNITGFLYNPTFTLSGSNNTHRAIHTVTGNVLLGSTSGNVLIGTTTDAGFRLDVNGTARVQGNLTQTGTSFTSTITGFWQIQNTGNATTLGSFISQQGMSYYSTQPFCLNVSSGAQANSASLQIDSTTKGFLPPRMTQAERNAIASPAIGLEIYQTDATEGKYIYKSSGWTYIG